MNWLPISPEARAKIYTVGSVRYSFGGLAALFAWMLWGDFCFTLMEAVVPSILPLKLRSLDSPNILIGFIMTTLPGIFYVTITPIVSFKSDRFRSRWGRRIPFILATMPFLVASLIAIGFSDDIGRWVHSSFFEGGTIGQAKVIIVVLAIFAACFDLFNMFVNTVFWYLFVDVVPQEMMGRFNAWFRVVGTLTGAFYNFFIFQFAESHMREIFLGAGLLYLFGFGIMCLKVKEGEYPPIDDGVKAPSFFDNVKIFARECFTSRYYWDIFLTYSASVFGGSIMVFNVFFLKSLGLDLGTIGKIGAISAITVPICLALCGPLVDRWHPVRVTAYLAAFDAILIQWANWVWLTVGTPPSAAWYLAIAATNSALFMAPFRAVNEVGGMSRLMRLLPQDRFGQFSGAMALVRAVAIMAGGTMAGLYVDMWKHVFPEENFFYRFNFTWMAPFTLLSFYFQYRTFRAWKRLGGETSYVAPSAEQHVYDLPPNPADTGRVEKQLLLVTGWALSGLQLVMLAWAYYYLVVLHDTRHAVVFAIAIGVNFALYFLYLRLVRFMERP